MKIARLHKTNAGANNNKYYHMDQISGSEFIGSFGRVGSSPQKKTYPMHRWDNILRGKIRKGYVDVTELQTVTTQSGLIYPSDPEVSSILQRLHRYSSSDFDDNYSVSAAGITELQVKKAQRIVDNISRFLSNENNISNTIHNWVNESLSELYTILPRQMKRVSDFLVNDLTIPENFQQYKTLLSSEQDTLDNAQVMSQVATSSTGETFVDTLGINMTSIEDGKEIDGIRTRLGEISSQFKQAWIVEKPAQFSEFTNYVESKDNQTVELLWHGSRTQNILSIMKASLLIRPSNAVHTGSMFGDGLYFSDASIKSRNYSSWSGSLYGGGSDRNGFMFLFGVHTGNQMRIASHNSECYRYNYDYVSQKGYDSVFADTKMQNSGGWSRLQHNEMIIYRPEQATMRYLVEIE